MDQMTDRVRRAAERAESYLHAVYVQACLAAGRPIDPAELRLPDWSEQYLADVYDGMCRDPDWQEEHQDDRG